MSDIANPHDRFVRELLGQPEHARDFLAHYLPAEVAACLALETLQVADGTFVDPELHEHRSDLLFRVKERGGKPVLVYVLFEHKSRVDPWTALQVLRYMVQIWAREAREGRVVSRLPAIVPLVLYHGRSPWDAARRFEDLVAAEGALRDYVPQL